MNLRLALPGICGALVAGCVTIGNPDRPIASILVPAPQPSAERTLVVVLPGFGGDAEALNERGIGQAVHQSWPEADVLLTSTTFAYYARRNVIERLDADVIEPARRKGYRNIWLAGASVGGMGAVFYEYQHPGELTGIVLLAPWLGSSEILDEVRDAGGVPDWNPGPKPATLDDDSYEREMWRVAKRWSEDPALAKRIWLVCGKQDRLLATSRLLASALPSSHVVELDGAHDWETFVNATGRIIARLRDREAAFNPAASPTLP